MLDRPREQTRAYLSELLWAAFLLNTIMGLVGLLIGAQLGSIRLGLGLFLGGALLITAVLGIVVAANFLIVWLLDRRGRRRRLPASRRWPDP